MVVEPVVAGIRCEARGGLPAPDGADADPWEGGREGDDAPGDDASGHASRDDASRDDASRDDASRDDAPTAV